MWCDKLVIFSLLVMLERSLLYAGYCVAKTSCTGTKLRHLTHLENVCGVVPERVCIIVCGGDTLSMILYNGTLCFVGVGNCGNLCYAFILYGGKNEP